MAKYLLINKEVISHFNISDKKMNRIFRSIGVKVTDDDSIALNAKQYVQLMEVFDETITNEDILAMNSKSQFSSFYPPVFAALCSSNGLTCLERLATYKQLFGPLLLKIDALNDEVTVELVFIDEKKTINRVITFVEQMFFVSLLRIGTGERIIPKKVEALYKYDNQQFVDFFGVEPIVSKRNVVTFDLRDLEKKFITENNIMWSYMEPEMKRRLAEYEIDDSYAASVRSSLTELLPTGQGSIDAVAKDLMLSPRTLQRRLSNEGTTFIKQLNHTRELLARNYLKDPELTNDEIAFLIGYSDSNSFTRAFQAWTGLTTSQYRRSYA